MYKCVSRKIFSIFNFHIFCNKVIIIFTINFLKLITKLKAFVSIFYSSITDVLYILFYVLNYFGNRLSTINEIVLLFCT